MSTEPTPRGIKTYEEFWPYYLREHSHPWTRRLHVLGTTLGLGIAAYSLATGCWRGLLGALVCGYFFAWISHFFIERNRPATFKYPWWSFISDFKMLWEFYRGRLRP